MNGDFGEAFWNERYRQHSAVWSGEPNPQLVSEACELAAGTALDAGCGEGADAVWLAERGWRVTAVDVSSVALERGAAAAARAGEDVARRIEWVHENLTAWSPRPSSYDLVSVQFMQLPRALREPMFRRLAAAVAPSGTLLVVGHHPSDLQTAVRRPRMPDLLYTANDVSALLEPSEWEIVVADTRPRAATDPDGRPATVHDTVVRARRIG